MTNKEINERVAKLCGWKNVPVDRIFFHGSSEMWESPGKGEFHETFPNYTESLDACREFMSKIDEKERDEFCMAVCQLERIHPFFEYEFWWAIINITPLERCEAFLRLKGQWE